MMVFNMSSLREEIKTLSGNKRRFFLLRIVDMDTKAALKLTGVTHGTYNSWCQQEDFVELYRRREELSHEYKQEAIQLIRRDTQLEAAFFEGQVILKMKEELESGDYNLIRTNLAKEVYSRLMGDLDAVPKTPVLSWEERLRQLITPPTIEITQGETVEAEYQEVGSAD